MTTTTTTTTPPPLMLCLPTKKGRTSTSSIKPSAIPPAFVVDSNGRKLFRSSCRARAVAKDHTPENAYLLVPEDVRHGYLLRCSHSWCIKTGRLFRYCVVCRQPVTKRNFHKRHGHGLIRYEKGRSILPADDELLEDADLLPSSAAPSFLPGVVIGGDRTTPLADAGATLVGTEEAAGVASATGNIVSDEDSSAAAGPQPVVSSGMTTTLSPEEMAWLQLFRERPTTSTQEDAMNKWYSSIVSTCYPGEQPPEPAPVVPPPPTTEEEEDELIEPLSLMHDEEQDEDYVGLETFDMVFDLDEAQEEGQGKELYNADLDFLLDRNYEIV